MMAQTEKTLINVLQIDEIYDLLIKTYSIETKEKHQFFKYIATLNLVNKAIYKKIDSKFVRDFFNECSEAELDALLIKSFKVKNLFMLKTLLSSPDKYPYSSRVIRFTPPKKLDTEISILSCASLFWQETLPLLLNEFKLDPNLENKYYQELEEISIKYPFYYRTMGKLKWRSPLHYASSNGNLESIKLLLAAGADVNGLDKNKRTPLHLAAIQNDPEIILALLDAGAQIDALDENQCTPLHIAAFYNSDKVITVLLEKGANRSLLCTNLLGKTEIQKIKNNSTAFIIAIRCGYHEAVNAFLKTENLKIFATSELKIILDYALYAGHVDFIYRLIEENPDFLHFPSPIYNFQWPSGFCRSTFFKPKLFNEFCGYHYELKPLAIQRERNKEMMDKIDELNHYDRTQEWVIDKIKQEIITLGKSEGLLTSSAAHRIKALENLIQCLQKNTHFKTVLEIIETWEESILSETNQTMFFEMQDHKNCISKFFAPWTGQRTSTEVLIEDLKNSVRHLKRPELWPKEKQVCIVEIEDTSLLMTV